MTELLREKNTEQVLKERLSYKALNNAQNPVNSSQSCLGEHLPAEGLESLTDTVAIEIKDDLIKRLRQDVKDAQKETYAALERGDQWRDRQQLAISNNEQKDIEIANLKYEIENMNKLLEQAYANEQVTDGIMRMYLAAKDRIPVEEGGRSRWM